MADKEEASDWTETVEAPAAPVSAPAKAPVGIGPAFDPETDGSAPATEEKSPYDVSDPSETPIPEAEVETESDPEAPQAEEEGDPEAEQEEGDDVDPQLEARALEAGFTKEEIAEVGNNVLLAKLLLKMAPAAPAAPAEAKKVATDPEFKIDLDPKEYDEKIVQTLKDMQAHYDKKIEALSKEHAENFSSVTQQRQAEAAAAEEKAVDSAFAGMAELKQFVGSKPMSEIPKNSIAFKNRREIYSEAVAIKRGYEATGKPVPPLEKLLRTAAHAVLGDKTKTIATEQVRQQVTERRSQAIARPTMRQGQGSTASPEQRARAAAQAFLEEKGEL